MENFNCIVYYDQWQMECCGTPFSVGDTIEWEVFENDIVFSPVDIGRIDYCYEAHDDRGGKIMILKGRVEDIKILYHRYELAKDGTHLTAVSGKLIKTDTVNGAERGLEDMQPAGYVVSLIECSIEE